MKTLKGAFTMKKVFGVLMVLTLIFSLVACSNNTTKEETSSLVQKSGNQSSTSVEESKNTNNSSTSTETNLKSLVVYFSWSGNTENVAKSIQKQTSSDIFEIVPTEPYSDNYDTVLILAQEEQRNNARPAISNNIENIGQYDVIYVGYPKMEQGYICV